MNYPNCEHCHRRPHAHLPGCPHDDTPVFDGDVDECEVELRVGEDWVMVPASMINRVAYIEDDEELMKVVLAEVGKLLVKEWARKHGVKVA